MDIAQWLRDLHLDEYEARFRKNHIDGSILSALTNDDLKDLGIASVGHRRKLLEAIAALAAPVPPPAGAERRYLTLMFCDLVGSTALSSRLDPEDLREVIGAYHAAAAAEVRRVGGFVAKFMGDGVLAYFGYPQAHEDDAERAVHAGLALVERIAKLDTAARLEARVGIATGLVVVGDLIGEGEARERGVVGETPNVAARLQELAPAGGVIIADGTRRLVGSLFDLRDLGVAAIRGLDAPVPVWQALRPSAIESRFEALRAGALTPLVGREEELELLLRRWQRARAGQGHVVLLTGEPGIGKSRLTIALRDELAGVPHTRLRYFCSPHHGDSAFYPFIAQLERAAGFSHDDPAAAKLDKLEALLGPAAQSQEDLALLAELLSLPAAERYPMPELSPTRKKAKIFTALLQQFEVLAKREPVLLIFEDLHWLDPSSRELLDRTIERIADMPALLIATFRPEFMPPWSGLPQVTTMALARLDRHVTSAMVEQVAGGATLPADVVVEIGERADGIPLFVEELTKAVLEAGGDDQARRTLAGAASTAAAVPPALHASLMARLDRLGPAAKEAAQIGAVLGREFGYELIRSVSARLDLSLSLQQLTDAGLLFCRGVAPKTSYLFKHALVQDAAYSTLLRRHRQQLHARTASVLEQEFLDIAERQPEVIAHHYTEGERLDDAITWWRAAGRRAHSRAGNIEATAYLRRALELIGRCPEGQERDVLELIARVELGGPLILNRGYGSAETMANYDRAWELCERTGSTEYAFPVLWGQFLATNVQEGIVYAGTNRAKRFLDLAEKQGDAGLQVVGHRMLGVMLVSAGDFGAGRQHLERGAALYDPIAHQGLTFTYHVNPGISCRVNLSLPLQYLGFFDQAAAAAEHGLAEARRLGHFQTMGVSLHLVARLRAFRRELEHVRVLASELIALSREHDATDWALVGEILLAWQAAYRGDLEQSLAKLRNSTATLRVRAPSHNWLPPYLLLEAELYGEAGRHEEQLELLNEIQHLIEEQGQPVGEAEVYRQRASALQARGAPAVEIDGYYQHAIEIAQRQSAKFWELRASVCRARFWCEQGEQRKAREFLAPVYSWFSEGFDTRDLIEAKALLDKMTGPATAARA